MPANEDKIPGRRYGFRADFRKDGGKLSHWLVQAVEQLGVQSGHPELKHAPLIMWGFSREGMHPPSFGEVYPNRLLGGIRFVATIFLPLPKFNRCYTVPAYLCQFCPPKD